MAPMEDELGAPTWQRVRSDQFDASLFEAVHGVADGLRRHWGYPVLSDQRLIELEHATTGATDTGELVVLRRHSVTTGELDAFGILSLAGDTAVGELLVPPTADEGEIAGLVTQLADATGDGVQRLLVWAFGSRPGDVHALEMGGFALTRTVLQMRCPLPLPPHESVDDGVLLRSFRPGHDDESWVEVNNRSFAGHPDQGTWTLDLLRARMSQSWFDPEGFVVAEGDGEMLGSCWTKVHAEADPPLGEIYVIGVDPAAQGRGLGRRLVAEGLNRLHRSGMSVGMLYVEADNDPAVRLYRSMGFVEHHADRCYERVLP